MFATVDYAAERESIALINSDNRHWLENRLRQARYCLVRELRDRFGRGRFVAKFKRLLSDDGKLALQWQTRPQPDAPESYDNQQTTSGFIALVDAE